MQEVLLDGLHIYRIITPKRFVASLMPSGGVGVVEAEAPLPVAYAPATLRFERPQPLAWCSARKCFLLPRAALFKAPP